MVECSQTCGIDNPGVNWAECRILGQDGNSYRRKALESIFIKEKKDRVVNRNEGSLDPIFNRAVIECMKRDKR